MLGKLPIILSVKYFKHYLRWVGKEDFGDLVPSTVGFTILRLVLFVSFATGATDLLTDLKALSMALSSCLL